MNHNKSDALSADGAPLLSELPLPQTAQILGDNKLGASGQVAPGRR